MADDVPPRMHKTIAGRVKVAKIRMLLGIEEMRNPCSRNQLPPRELRWLLSAPKPSWFARKWNRFVT